MSAERRKPRLEKPLDTLSTGELVARLHGLNYQLGFFGVSVPISTMVEPSEYADLFPNHPQKDQLIPYSEKPELSIECYQPDLVKSLKPNAQVEIKKLLRQVSEVGITLKRKLRGDVKWDEPLTQSPRKYFGDCLRDAAFVD